MANVPIERRVDQELSLPQYLAMALHSLFPPIRRNLIRRDQARGKNTRRLTGEKTRSKKKTGINKPTPSLSNKKKKATT